MRQILVALGPGRTPENPEGPLALRIASKSFGFVKTCKILDEGVQYVRGGAIIRVITLSISMNRCETVLVRIPFGLSVFLRPISLNSGSTRSCSIPLGPGPGAPGPSGAPGPGPASRAGPGL